jgi:hypothetical protein
MPANSVLNAAPMGQHENSVLSQEPPVILPENVIVFQKRRYESGAENINFDMLVNYYVDDSTFGSVPHLAVGDTSGGGRNVGRWRTKDRMPDLPRLAKQIFPAYLYVDIPTVTRQTSLLVLLICLFSLSLSWLTGFNMIYPFISLIVAIGAIIFYLIAILMGRQYETGRN